MANSEAGFKIPPEERQSWLSLTAIWIGNMICLPALMVGGFLAAGLSIAEVFIALVVGFAIILVYMCLIGMQSEDLGLPTVSCAENALGTLGSRFVISLLIGLACIGWFGVQAAVCGASFSSMFGGITGVQIPETVSTLFWGGIMLLTALFGYKAMKYLNYVVVPLLVLVLGYTAYASLFRAGGVQTIAAYRPPQSAGLLSGFSIVVGSFALGGVISGDCSRYAKSRADVIKSSVLGVLPVSLLIMGLGAASAIASGQYDITQILVSLGLPYIGLLVLILATWSTNILNAYSGGIALSNALGFTEKRYKLTTAVAGVLGTVLGAAGLMTKFTGFLGILSAFIPPVAGVMIAAYWIVGKGKRENFKAVKGVNAAGVVSFAVGAIAAYLSSLKGFLIAPINGIVLSMALYIVLNKVLPGKE
ncbi:MAG: cytosine permease [Treponema sp.]|nr:cytosine permease [Treponema sp.]